jgi:hypothetical protein
MEDPKQGEQHWQELAELFGLAPEKPAAKPAAPIPVAREEARSTPAPKPVEEIAPMASREPEPPRYEEEETSRLEPEPEETQGWEAEFDADDPDDTAIVDEQSLADDTAADADTADFSERPPAGSPEEDKPRRGRRRRRRGKRRGGEGEGREGREPAAAPPVRQEARSEPVADESRGRNRHRGSRRDEEDRRRAPAPVEAAVEEEWSNDEDREKRESDNRPLSLEDTDFTNWNVPSWQELIASLYRPDR